jgi:hypothetical protein
LRRVSPRVRPAPTGQVPTIAEVKALLSLLREEIAKQTYDLLK